MARTRKGLKINVLLQMHPESLDMLSTDFEERMLSFDLYSFSRLQLPTAGIA